MASNNLLKPIRLIHLYLGVFAAPALMFFSFTGAVQTFSLHETTKGSNYKPPQFLVNLGQLHKKQTLVVPTRPPQPPNAKPAGPKPEATDKPGDQPQAAKPEAPKPPAEKPGSPPRGPEKNLLPMKIFFLTIAISLLTSTLTGLYMSFKYARNKTVVTATLLAGIIIPALLLIL